VSDRGRYTGCGTYDRDKSAGNGEKDLAGRIVGMENNAGRRELWILVCWDGDWVRVGRVLAEGGWFYCNIMADAGVVVVLGGIHGGENERTGLNLDNSITLLSGSD
jgi:hypothetical protein